MSIFTALQRAWAAKAVFEVPETERQMNTILPALMVHADAAIDAEDVVYDPTVSGLTATDVQAAIDELAASPGGSGAPYGAEFSVDNSCGGPGTYGETVAIGGVRYDAAGSAVPTGLRFFVRMLDPDTNPAPTRLTGSLATLFFAEDGGSTNTVATLDISGSDFVVESTFTVAAPAVAGLWMVGLTVMDTDVVTARVEVDFA